MTAAAPGSLFGTFLSVSRAERRRVLRARGRRRAPGQAAHRRRAPGRADRPVGRRQDVVAARRADAGAHPPRADRRHADQLSRPRAGAGARDQRGRASRRRCRDRTRPIISAASRARRKGGLVLILDNLEEVLAPAPDSPRAAAPPRSPRWRCGSSRRRRARAWSWRSTTTRYARLDTITTALGGPSGKLGAPATMTLPPLDRGRDRRHHRAQRGAVGDAVREPAWPPPSRPIWCATGPAVRFDLQLAARAIVDLQAGVAAPLPPQRRARGAAGALAGGRVPRRRAAALARRALLAAGERAGRQRSRSGRRRPGADATAAPRRWPRCSRAGCWSRTRAARKEVFALAHPALREIDRRLRDHRSGARHATRAARSPAASRPASACACRSCRRFTGTCAGR